MPVGDDGLPADPMPPDPFSAPLADWSGMASALHEFFAAMIAAGFTEGQALHLATSYLNVLLSVMMTSAASQQPGG